MRHIRVIARLDVKGPNVVKGVQFEALRVMGKPNVLAHKYMLDGADELLYLDTVASLYRRDNLLHIVREASQSIFIPFTAGGGVRSIRDIHDLLEAGAEKVAINTAATKRPELIKEASSRFGSQCIVLSIEAKRQGASWRAYTDNGRETTGLDVVEWAKHAESLGAGEILLTSVDREGTERGLEAELIRAVSAAVSIPIIVGGGSSSPEEIASTMAACDADAVAVGSLLHYGKTSIAKIKDTLATRGLSVREPTATERAREHAPREADIEDYNRFTMQQFKDEAPHKRPVIKNVPTADSKDADVAIINYGINNVRSVAMAFESLGKKVAIVNTAEEIRRAKRLILPGVGAFGDGMRALNELRLVDAIRESAESGVPLFGICLGMQLLFSESEEFGKHGGLDIIEGNVTSFPDPAAGRPSYKLPHIGWTEIHPPDNQPQKWQGTCLRGTKPGQSVYFVHSYYPVPKKKDNVLALASYGGVDFCAALERGNITATQFHAEKSGRVGLRMLKSFCEKTRA